MTDLLADKPSQPLVSVVVPTYNRATFIGKTLSSVFEQTYSTLEIIVVDDCSDDGTEQVIRSLDDPRIKYIQHRENKGAPAARNTGIRAAKGEYIAFLDSDDSWLPTKLAKQLEKMAASPLHPMMVYTGIDYVDVAGNTRHIQIPKHRGDIFSNLLVDNVIGSTSTALVKREGFQRVGLFDEHLPSRQDYDLWLRVARAFPVDYVEEPLTKHTEHNERITANLTARILGRNAIFQKICSDLERDPKKLARYFYETGVLHFENDDIKMGRHMMLKTMRTYLLPKAPLLWVISYAHKGVTKRAREISLFNLKRWLSKVTPSLK